MSKHIQKAYPKILSNIPKGKDLFEAGSHQNISNTIIVLIEKQGDIIEKQIIGLEGSWGTGKSNIIRIIEENTKEKYLHFTYDTWTHQEDLTRKSILQELIFFLKSSNVKVIDEKDKIWINKENQLSQKIISKNTTYLPKLKSYYVLTIISFIIIKFGNEIYKQTINNRLYGFYDNSFGYLIDNFYFNLSHSIKWEYLLKLAPFLLLLSALYYFGKSLIKEIYQNKSKVKEEKLPISQVIGKLFYWISGEKLESNSNETINEKEPSNQMFRKFLNDIDNQLEKKNKKLIFTLDNTDRLSEDKLKNIWSTINIFFAESNNLEFLKNIWLIVPYDEIKLVKAMPEGGKGLLEKTFAITFNVPPPLLSNWELFFNKCFDEAFGMVEIENKIEELQLLKKIFQTSDETIFPRKIINFINQISSYYIQNNEIKLRYNAIFVLNKDKLIEGNINENILNKNSYINGVRTIFQDDDLLEINISKIVYGLKSDIEAQEVIFANIINDVLNDKSELTQNIIDAPGFITYFDKEFKKFVNSRNSESELHIFNVLTQILIKVRKIYLDTFHKPIYDSLWMSYSELILKNSLFVFDETYQSIIKYCKKKMAIKIIDNTLSHIKHNQRGNPLETSNFAIIYLTFLEDLDNFLLDYEDLSFKDINIEKNYLPADIFLDSLKSKNLEFERYNLSVQDTSFRNFFLDKNKGVNRTLIVNYSEQISSLKDYINIEFIVEEINSSWIKSAFKSIEEVETLIMLYDTLKPKFDIKIYNLEFTTFDSLIELLKVDSLKSKALIASLLIINFSEKFASLPNDNFDDFLSEENDNLVKEIKSCLFRYLPQNKLINLLKIPVILGNSNLYIINQFSSNFFSIKDVDYDTFMWVFINYNKILQFNSIEEESFISTFLNENYKEEFKLKFSEIEMDFIKNSDGALKEKILLEGSEYLKNNIHNFPNILLDTVTREYKLLFYLVENESLSDELINALLILFPSVINFNSILTESHYSNIMKIKSHFSSEFLNGVIENRLKRNPRKGFIFFVPEIFNCLSNQSLPIKNSVMTIILQQKEFYTRELIDYVIQQGNQTWSSILNSNIKSSDSLYDYAVKQGLL